VVAQVEFEGKIYTQIITFLFQGLNYRRFQRGFNKVNMHRLTSSTEISSRFTSLAKMAGGMRIGAMSITHPPSAAAYFADSASSAAAQGLTLVHFSAQDKYFCMG
jgi:hypothetical protein